MDYYPPTDQLGSYGQGPLGEPTFEPFHHAVCLRNVYLARFKYEGTRATGNHYVLIALHLTTVTTLTLRRWRGPAPTGQATSIPPARRASANISAALA